MTSFKLIQFDGLLLQRILRSQFSRRSDLVLLFIGLPVFILAAIEQFRDLPVRLGAQDPWFCVMTGLALVGPIEHVAETRLRWHREHSVLASLALAWPNAVAYKAIAACLPAPVIVWLVAGLWTHKSWANALWLLAGCLLAVIILAAARLLPPMKSALAGQRALEPTASGPVAQADDRGSRIRDLVTGTILRRGMTFRTGLAVAICTGTLLGASLLIAAEPRMDLASLIAATSATAALCLVRLSKQDASLLRYLRQIGVHPKTLIMAQLAIGGSFAAALLACLLIGGQHRLEQALAISICLIAFAWITTMRSLHYAAKTRLAADGAFQLDLVALVILGFSFAPAALMLVMVRILMLNRFAKANLWKLP